MGEPGSCGTSDIWKGCQVTDPSKSQDHGSGEPPWLAVPHSCCCIPLVAKLSTVHMTPRGEDPWKFMLSGSWILLYASFAFDEFNLYPFMVMNQDCEYNSVLSPNKFWKQWF